jgi:hypothetical protein
MDANQPHPAHPAPLTMLQVSGAQMRVLSDRDVSVEIWTAIDATVAELRGSVETAVASAFGRKLLSEAAAVALSERLDAHIRNLNEMKLQQHEAARNANDFYTLAIDVELSHRRANEPLRARGEPLNIDVRQTALGPSTLIEDDDCPTADRLHVSLF